MALIALALALGPYCADPAALPWTLHAQGAQAYPTFMPTICSHGLCHAPEDLRQASVQITARRSDPRQP